MSLSREEAQRISKNAENEIKYNLEKLEEAAPGITEGIGAAVGVAIGGGGAFAALVFGGSVAGLSAAGITSGLATAGAIVGGGMAAGIGVLAAPIAVLGIAGYAWAKKRKNAKIAAALNTAISNLYDLQERLLQNAEYFREELATVKATIQFLTSKMKKS